MARTTVTQEMKILMNELYYKNHNYSAVAREVGVSPSTVKRYIIEGYIPIDKAKLKEIDISKCRGTIENKDRLSDEDFNLKLTPTEVLGIHELWGELSL